ncbi:hypothetical protein DDE82_007445 [Stemphylium lycopersici]|uniref:Uncharacterized protein n=1 Tax=Stemphylium lycopersici TaxID=183478 RepID=A0A364MVV6_STELY|nr:hypothetical protein TW65_01262 [Stemphylium lycopersici]RAR00286.1 hypothetical protein DDE82_007445 [Stemphylium lycopersici]RAR05177.1 hypothetical protein DDE83_007539 [Stemphylium lycopersici]
METWMSWAMFLAIGAAAYWYYAHQNNNADTRGRSTTGKSTTSSLKEAVNWDSETKPKQKAAKAKPARKQVKTPAQDNNNNNNNNNTTKAAAPKAAAEKVEDVAPPAAAVNQAPSGKDVSDMLGERAASPAVMNIKPSEKPAKSVKAQTQKAEVAQETKKQRQNRKKVEEAKAAREEEEKARKALEEKQRRVAREARGEPAKNGLQQSKPPASNAWTEVPSRGAVQPPKAAPTGQLLDTFDASATAPATKAPTNGKTSTSAPYNGLPSEEEQLRLAMEDSAWTTVPKGGKPKRKTVNEELAEERDEVTTTKAPQSAKPVRPTEIIKENKNPSSRYQILAEEFNPKTGDEIDDWAVM